MQVKVFLKNGRTFEYGENALFEDREAGRFILSCGILKGGRLLAPGDPWGPASPYEFKDESYICYSLSDVDHFEVRDNDAPKEKAESVWFWPRAKTEDGEDLFTYDSLFTMEKALEQFSIWEDHYGYKIKEAWVDRTDGIHINVQRRWVEA